MKARLLILKWLFRISTTPHTKWSKEMADKTTLTTTKREWRWFSTKWSYWNEADDKEEGSTRSQIRLVWRAMSTDVRGRVMNFSWKSVKIFLGQNIFSPKCIWLAPSLILGFFYKNDFRNPGLPLLLEANYFVVMRVMKSDLRAILGTVVKGTNTKIEIF